MCQSAEGGDGVEMCRFCEAMDLFQIESQMVFLWFLSCVMWRSGVSCVKRSRGGVDAVVPGGRIVWLSQSR